MGRGISRVWLKADCREKAGLISHSPWPVLRSAIPRVVRREAWDLGVGRLRLRLGIDEHHARTSAPRKCIGNSSNRCFLPKFFDQRRGAISLRADAVKAQHSYFMGQCSLLTAHPSQMTSHDR